MEGQGLMRPHLPHQGGGEVTDEREEAIVFRDGATEAQTGELLVVGV